MVGIDGSECGAKALRWAAGEARVHGATLVVLHAWQYPYTGSDVAMALPALRVGKVEDEARMVLRRAVKDEADTLAGLLVEESVVYGEAGAALVVAARDADLVVVGSRGRGGFAGLLLGSVSQHVAHRAPCPVVIVGQEA